MCHLFRPTTQHFGFVSCQYLTISTNDAFVSSIVRGIKIIVGGSITLLQNITSLCVCGETNINKHSSFITRFLVFQVRDFNAASQDQQTEQSGAGEKTNPPLRLSRMHEGLHQKFTFKSSSANSHR